MKVLIMIGEQNINGNVQSAAVFIDGKPLSQALTPHDRPEWIYIGRRGCDGKWCTAVYGLSPGFTLQFVAKSSGKPDIVQSFNTSDCEAIEVDGHVFDDEVCGYITTFSS